MPRKCCVGKCRLVCSGTDEKVPGFSFPTNNDECNRWIRALPYTINNVTKYISAYEKHWPTRYEKIRKKGSDRTRNPPSIFEGFLNRIFHKHISPSRNVQKR